MVKPVSFLKQQSERAGLTQQNERPPRQENAGRVDESKTNRYVFMIPLLARKNISPWQKCNLKSGGMFMAVFMDHLIQRPDLKQTK